MMSYMYLVVSVGVLCSLELAGAIACNLTRQAGHNQDPLSFSTAFLSSCSQDSKAWTAADAAAYFREAWTADSAACSRISMFGRSGDGEYAVCTDDEMRARAAQRCVAVTVGLNDDTSFEKALHQQWPHCKVHGYDGSLVGNRAHLAKQIPPFIIHHPKHFSAVTWRNYSDVFLLKADCEDCEWHGTLHPNSWVANVKTCQVNCARPPCARTALAPRVRARSLHARSHRPTTLGTAHTLLAALLP